MTYEVLIIVKPAGAIYSEMRSVYLKAESIEDATAKVRKQYPEAELRMVTDKPTTDLL